MLPPPMNTIMANPSASGGEDCRRAGAAGAWSRLTPARPKIAVPTRTSGRALGDRRLEVGLMPIDSVSRRSPVRSERIEQRAQRAELRRAASRRIGRRLGHRHQPAQREPRQRRDAPRAAQAPPPAATPALRRLAADVDLQADVERRQPAGRARQRSATFSRSTVCTQSNRSATARVLLLCSGPTGAIRSPAGRRGRRSWPGLLHVVLAEARWPARYAARTAAGGERLAHREQP